jgi:3-oxoadipate enol-lactonase
MLLHGWSATADLNWHHCFGPLAEQFHVLAIDHRGHGRGLRHSAPFRLEDCADDVAALAAQLGIERLIAVGYSMGGPIAQLLWQRHRWLVDGLVLCATSAAFGSSPRVRALFRVAAGLSAPGAADAASSLASSAVRAVSRWNGRRGEVPWGVEQLAQHDWKQVIEAGHQIGRYDARAWIGSVSVPTAVVATTYDEVVPARDQIALAQEIPSATLRILPSGHHGCVTEPDKFVPALVDACREVADRTRARKPAQMAGYHLLTATVPNPNSVVAEGHRNRRAV